VAICNYAIYLNLFFVDIVNYYLMHFCYIFDLITLIILVAICNLMLAINLYKVELCGADIHAK